MVGGKKMSKSLGNFYNLRDIEEHFSDTKSGLLYRGLRLSFISGKYRDTLDFTFEKLKSQIQTIENIDTTIKRLRDFTPKQT
jgi:cysteinyl-tRNA synthetase